jgi:transcriptional regulator with AAA-type ATPase domain
VNAEYAVISDELGLENIRERLFRGICQSREMYQEILKEFMNKKNALYAVVNEFPYLSQRSKKDIIMYLDTFFDQLNKQKDIDLLINNFLNTCKKL